MRPARSLLTALIALLLLAPTCLLAQTAAPAKDPIDAAIDTFWNTGKQDYLDVKFSMELDRARKLLIEQRDQSLKKVAALLDNNEVQVRLNAAVVLAGMAQAGGDSPELLQALKRCVGDSSPALALWGAQGIIANPQFPDTEKLATLTLCLKSTRPRPLRVAVALAASDAKLKPAIPVIIKYMESLKDEYRKQIDTALTPKSEGRIEVGPGGADASFPGAGAAARPGAGGRPGAAQPPGATPPGATQPAGSSTQPAGTSTLPVATPTPKKVLPPIDPAKLTMQEQETLIRDLETLPTVMELHHIGLALEALVNSAYALQRASFDFDATPPWALNVCVDAASKWLTSHPAEEFTPAATVRPAPAPAAPGAAPAAPGAAPATPGAPAATPPASEKPAASPATPAAPAAPAAGENAK